MIYYKDTTFCSYYKDCADANKCDRCLTPEVIERAHRWWGSAEAPISQFSSEPMCHVPIRSEEC